MYKISIILPTFNVKNYLKRALDSLKSQTIGFDNLQIIFVDDCSTDGSREVIDEYAKQYDNIFSIHLKNNSGSAGKPRTEGIKFALADYVMFLDPDDALMENSCEVLYDRISNYDVDIVVGGYRKDDWFANWTSTSDLKESLIINPPQNMSIFMNPPGLAAKIFKKELITKNNISFYTRIPAEDLIFLTECYLNANSILSLNDFIVYRYYVRKDKGNESVTNSVTKEYMYEILDAYNITLDLMETFNVDDILKTVYFAGAHISFFVRQLNSANLTETELKEYFNSERFLKFRNYNYIISNNELNNFFERLIKNPSIINTDELIPIFEKSKKLFISSDKYIPETEPILIKNNNIDEDEDLRNINKKLYHLLKQTSIITNYINDLNK